MLFYKIQKTYLKMNFLSKKELEEKYGVPVYVRWNIVPSHLHPRSWFKERGIDIPASAQPDAIKGGGGFTNSYSFLFDQRKYL